MPIIILFLAVAYAFSQYGLDPQSIAVFPHHESPFTQGLFVVSNDGDAESTVGRCLTGCLEATLSDKWRFSGRKEKTSACYTECLKTHSLSLYESIGGYGTSEFRVVRDFKTGIPDSRVSLPKAVFGEGSDLVHTNETHHVFLMGTWRSKLMYVLSQPVNGGPIVLERSIKMRHHRELWGLAADTLSQQVWITTGTSAAYVYKTHDLLHGEPLPSGQVNFRCEGQPVSRVNELDFDKSTGTLWANVWFSTFLYQFDADSGKCLAKLDIEGSDSRLRTIAKSSQSNVNAVWNGVTTLGDRWLIFTGKLFPYIFMARYMP